MINLNVLIVDDEQIYRDEVAEFLDGLDCKSFKAGTPSTALKNLSENDIGYQTPGNGWTYISKENKNSI